MKILVFLVAVFTVCTTLSPGHIENFEQTDSGYGSILLEWDFIEGDDPLVKYTLVLHEDLSLDIYCPESHCSAPLNDLEACEGGQFELTPYFDNPENGTYTGDIATTVAFAADEVPGPPADFVVGNITGRFIEFMWNGPVVNPKCAAGYVISCDINMKRISEDSHHAAEDYEYDMLLGPNDPCTTYICDALSFGFSGEESDAIIVNVTTGELIPSAPTNLRVVPSDPFPVILVWDPPTDNKQCVDFYRLCSTLVGTQDTVCQTVKDTLAEMTFMETCDTYDVSVTPVTLSGVEGPALNQTVTITTDTVTCSPL
nr:uncharacterized protein LOC128686205 [Cherax quadricarinatus]